MSSTHLAASEINLERELDTVSARKRSAADRCQALGALLYPTSACKSSAVAASPLSVPSSNKHIQIYISGRM